MKSRKIFIASMMGEEMKKEKTNKPQHKNKQERNFTSNKYFLTYLQPVQNNLIHFGAVLMVLDCETHFFHVKFEES